MKNLLWNGKVPWMVKVLLGNVNANKETLFFKATLLNNMSHLDYMNVNQYRFIH